jgi:hypothetical protein
MVQKIRRELFSMLVIVAILNGTERSSLVNVVMDRAELNSASDQFRDLFCPKRAPASGCRAGGFGQLQLWVHA